MLVVALVFGAATGWGLSRFVERTPALVATATATVAGAAAWLATVWIDSESLGVAAVSLTLGGAAAVAATTLARRQEGGTRELQ